MISKVLSRDACKNCKFCCVFLKDSLWELPVFPKETYERIIANDKTKEKYFEKIYIDDDTFYVKMKLEDKYLTDANDETVPCIFLDENHGCTLNDEDKPLECKIWPLRVMDKDDNLIIAFETICPELGETPSKDIKKLVEEIKQDIKEYTSKYPFIAKPYDEMFPVISKIDD